MDGNTTAANLGCSCWPQASVQGPNGSKRRPLQATAGDSCQLQKSSDSCTVLKPSSQLGAQRLLAVSTAMSHVMPATGTRDMVRAKAQQQPRTQQTRPGS
jgi:hypothetical protein